MCFSLIVMRERERDRERERESIREKERESRGERGRDRDKQRGKKDAQGKQNHCESYCIITSLIIFSAFILKKKKIVGTNL